jgi:hypothetical protein
MKKIALNIFVLLLFVTFTQAQEKEEKSEKVPIEKTVQFKLKNVEYTYDSIAKPTIYIDGKLFNFDISLIDQNQIESMNVIKGEDAKNLYNSPQGVILIKTKSNANKADYSLSAGKAVFRIKDGDGENDTNPMIIIDGKKVDKKVLKKLNPNNIESIEVFKDEKAIKLYNAPNGVIVVKTKKKNYKN